MTNSIKWRSELKKKPKRLVIKLGSSAVTRDGGGVDFDKLHNILADVSYLLNQGVQVVIVSSGAIHTGRAFLKTRKNEISMLQALSAVGQPMLMSAYHDFFAKRGFQCAQILLTHEDFRSSLRYKNARNTLNRLLENFVVPVLNENDTVSYSEITVGDNDQLAALTCKMTQPDVLVILTGTDGLCDRDPKKKGATIIPSVKHGEKLKGVLVSGRSAMGRGGMKTKLEAIRKTTGMRIPVILSNYRHKSPVLEALTRDAGTFFEGKKK
ncbi:MAG: glutamate 5-kinase [Deltaproteobacteria bacterium CG11_big_fil_rev_8_21_14_0_20_47_16]|nr:MAG: glutamate 5-kinase [Deltaproteobacteria bacterium CG11_big_fil_rev_8_21_14_0_20_47_16]